MTAHRRTSERLQNVAKAAVLLATCACLVLWLVRIYFAISFIKPYMIVTTGLEEESLFSIWKFTQHQAIYANPHSIPFAASYFNWGYYFLYGSIANACVSLLRLDAIWVPTVGRLISLVFALIAGGTFALAIRDFVRPGLLRNSRFAWAWIVIAAVGPLVGFWCVTVRPDIGALAFESAGLYLILRYMRKPRMVFIVLASLMFYSAWGFKQSSVTMLTGSVLALLMFKRWRAFITLSGIWWLLVLVTLILGGATYRECILFSQTHMPLLLSLGIRNALRAEIKNPFLLLCVIAVIWFFWRRIRVHKSKPVETTLALVVLFSLSFALVTSCKVGANDNYYMPAAWAAMLAFAVIWEEIDSPLQFAGLAVCSAILVGAIALTPTGRTFYYSYRYQDVMHRIVAGRLSHLGGPAIVTERYSNLPWVQRFKPHFVLGYAYYNDRDFGVPYEDSGWEGLARQGYFATIVIERSFTPPPSLLQKYRLVDEYKDAYDDYQFYQRIGPGGP